MLGVVTKTTDDLDLSAVRGSVLFQGEGSFPGAVLKGAAGCISSDMNGGNCGRGAVLAAGAEFATGLLHYQSGGNTEATAETMLRYGNPILAALTAGGDVGQFSTNQGIADSQLKNNYLTHTQRGIFLAKLAACNGNETCIDKWVQEYTALSDENNAALIAAIEAGDLDKIEEIRAQIPTDMLEYQAMVFAYLKDDPVAASKFADVLNRGSVINIDGNLVTASDATFYALRKGYYSNDDFESMAGLGISEFGPMGMSPNLAGLLGARGIIGVGRVASVPEVSSSHSFRFKFLENTSKEIPKIVAPYSRTSGATTRAQREAVQGQPCIDCGITTSKQIADYKKPLVKEYYETGTIDRARMRSIDAVQPQCPTCSARQGAEMSRYSRQKKEEIGR